MADAKISALTAVTTPAATDQYPCNQGGTTKMTTHKQLVSIGMRQILTASGAVTAGVNHLELDHDSVIIAATIATPVAHHGLFHVKNTSDAGTAAHTLTLTAGTFDGTNNVATLNAGGEALTVWFDSEGDGVIITNTSSVALS